MRKFAVALAALFMFVAVQEAGATPPTSIFGGEIPCTTLAQPDGRTICSGPGGDPNAAPASNKAVENTVPSYDGTPIDINFVLPNEEVFGPGPYPLAMYFHGFGGGKENPNGDLKRFTDEGMAAFSMTERGFKFSCGKANAITTLNNDTANACNKGYIHLMDSRYEVRDAQYLVSLLADEDLILPKKIGTVGASYGGAKSMSLAALKNRIMLPGGNTLAPWKSPDGKDMEIAVSAPIVPPTDFAYSLVPNGRTLDYVTDSPYLGPDGKAPYGVMKAAIINALFGAGDTFTGQNGTDFDPLFDVPGWRTLMSDGEPYNTPGGETMVHEMTTHHSSYYIDHSTPPAPLLIAEGLTDDLFPIDEAIRFYNRTKHEHPDATVGMLFADIGHPRAPLTGENEQGRPADKEMGYQVVDEWFRYYLLGEGEKPTAGVMVKSQVCPYEQPSGGPFTAATWADFSPGELRVSDPTKRVITKDSGDGEIAGGFMTLIPACEQQAKTDEPGTVTYDFPVTPAGGFTLGGAPTVIADIEVENGGESQIAARLLEISGTRERVIARGVYRPDESGRQVIQLHGNVYHFAAGTRARIQLLAKDGQLGLGANFSYIRPSNDQRDVTISNADVRLPVMEEPGSLGGLVKAPAKKVLPAGYELAEDFASIGSVAPDGSPRPATRATVKGTSLKLSLDCGGVNLCRTADVEIKGTKKPLKGVTIAKKTGVALTADKSTVVSFKLTAKARKAFKDSKKRKVIRKRGKKRTKVVKVAGLKKTTAKVTVRGWNPARSTNLAITRNGQVK